ncbi:DUF935 domain-containing protein [Salmonella enterica subsp. enterica]|nr:DUF935 domain-containing protein [Salmonella enterica subsp. enterica serovar Telelkebir]
MARTLKIVDASGNPITIEEDPQTGDAQIAALMQRYPEHPSSGLTPARAAELLREAERGNIRAQSELAADMEEKDTHLFSELGKRRRAWLNVQWNLKAPENATPAEQRDTEMVEGVIRGFSWFTDCLFDASDALLRGFSCQEYTGWVERDGLVVPAGVQWIDPSLFRVTDGQLRINDYTTDGTPLRPFGWIRHIAKSKSGYVGRTGLVRTLVWPFIFKNYSLRDLAEFLEIYGLPIRLGKYPEGATADEKATLLRAVMAIGHAAGGIIPRGMDIDFQSAANGQADPFEYMIEWGEKAISKAVLGGTLTSQADGAASTNALGNVHENSRIELRDSDLQQVADTLARDLVFPLWALNAKSYRSPLRAPTFEFDTTSPEDLTQFSLAMPRLVRVGVQIPESWIHQKLGIPEPVDGERVLEVITPEGSQGGAELSARKQFNTAALSATKNTDPEEQLDNALDAFSGDDWATAIGPMLKPVVAAMQKDGPQAALEKAAALFPQMDTDQLTELLTRAFFVAELWGSVNAEQ